MKHNFSAFHTRYRLLILAMLTVAFVQAQSELIILENAQCELTIDVWGGAYTSFELQGQEINPLSWALTEKQMPANNKGGAPFKGHFLCLGRWGSPSEGEIKAGIPHNGEQSNTHWQVASKEATNLAMNNTAPLDDLSVSRAVELDREKATFLVREIFTNTGTSGRISNVVQHVTLELVLF